MTCNRDCFNCTYQDCITDNMTEQEFADAKKRDRQATGSGSSHFYWKDPERYKKEAKEYYKKNRDKCLEKNRKYREKHREKLIEYSKRYREEHREELNRKRREKYLMKKG